MKTYGLVGKKLGHSFSKRYFEEKHGYNLAPTASRYLNFELSDIHQIISLAREHPDLHGLNVTIPYKSDVIPFLNRLSPEASAIGAVNVIKITRDPINHKPIYFSGYNTDFSGFKHAISPLLKPNHQSALVIGNGGASASIRYALSTMGITFQCLCRSPKSSDEISFDEMDSEKISKIPIIINTTPLGTWPDVDQMPPISLQGINESHLVFDLVYNPEETKLMREAKKKGAIVSNGLIMLRKQADLAIEIWEDQRYI
jgi:shikimate dehydrogenase